MDTVTVKMTAALGDLKKIYQSGCFEYEMIQWHTINQSVNQSVSLLKKEEC